MRLTNDGGIVSTDSRVLRDFPNRLSPSALARYRTCPRRFLWQDVERRPVRNEPTPTLFVGNVVHQALNMIFSLRAGERTLSALEGALRGAWRRERNKQNVFLSRAEESFHGERAITMLRRYHATHDLNALNPVARERTVAFTLPGGIELSGRVDRIDPLPGGTLEVIDYKTGGPALEADDLRWEPAAQIYLMGSAQTLSTRVERVRFVYLDSGDEPIWEPEEEDLPTIAERLANYVTSIANDDRFEATPGWPCRNCPFAKGCSAAAV
jgi:putative RecB family exonuclease